LRETVEWGVQGVKRLGFGILNLSSLSLYHCTQYFSIVKKKTGSLPVNVGILPNHINYLCTCVIDVRSLVLYFQTCLLHKGLVGNWLPIKLPIFPAISIRAKVAEKCSPWSLGLKAWRSAEVLFMDGVRSTIHEWRYCSWVIVPRVLGGRSRQIRGAAPTVRRSMVRFARLACSGSGGSFLKIGLLR
jgi:hypothetical protein